MRTCSFLAHLQLKNDMCAWKIGYYIYVLQMSLIYTHMHKSVTHALTMGKCAENVHVRIKIEECAVNFFPWS